MQEKLLKIINNYGLLEQLKYIHSEYFELDEAIINYCDEEDIYIPEIKKRYKDHITEEIADVEMMLDQFKVYFGINQEKINKIKLYKANRQIDRINHLPK
jgi:hypothetical protein